MYRISHIKYLDGAEKEGVSHRHIEVSNPLGAIEGERWVVYDPDGIPNFITSVVQNISIHYHDRRIYITTENSIYELEEVY